MKSSGKKGSGSNGKKGMTRRELLKNLAVSGPLLQAGMTLKATSSRKAGKSQRLPVDNVIVFMTDQERLIQHFPADWESQNLPGLTRLKRNGLSFEYAFTNACMCSPARSTFFSGYFPAQHGVKYTLEENMTDPMVNPQVELPVNLKNVATVMSAAGFNTVYKGKWHCSKASTAADLGTYGFQRWNPPDAGANQDPGQAGGGKTDIAANLPNDQRIMYGAAYDQEGAIDYLKSEAAKQQPFFLVVSIVNPHDVLAYPMAWDSEHPGDFGYDDSVLVGNIGIPETIGENLSIAKPTVQAQLLALTNVGLGPLPTRRMQENYLNFYGNLMKMSDNYLSQLLDTLTDLGLLENTLIIRTADHGEMGLTHGGQRQKNFNFYEESTRVPLVYSNPKMYKQAFQSKSIVSHVDFLPTIASLFDAPSAERAPWQGIDYSDLVLHPSSRPVQDYTVFTYDDFQSGQMMGPYPGLTFPPFVPAPNHVVSIREDRYKLAEYNDPSRPLLPIQLEMYDRLKDPLETQNIAWPTFPRTQEQQKELDRLKEKLAVVKATRLQPLP